MKEIFEKVEDDSKVIRNGAQDKPKKKYKYFKYAVLFFLAFFLGQVLSAFLF